MSNVHVCHGCSNGAKRWAGSQLPPSTSGTRTNSTRLILPRQTFFSVGCINVRLYALDELFWGRYLLLIVQICSVYPSQLGALFHFSLLFESEALFHDTNTFRVGRDGTTGLLYYDTTIFRVVWEETLCHAWHAYLQTWSRWNIIILWQASYATFSGLLERRHCTVNDTHMLSGLFETKHMQFRTARNKDGAGEPTLAEMTEKAIRILSHGNKGYFLFVEGT